MSKNSTRILRLIIGFAVSIVVLLVLDLISWKTNVSQYSSAQLHFVMAATAAISVLIAALAGAIVARSNFVGPAVFLALGVWYLAVSFLQALDVAYSPSDIVPYLLANVGGLSLTIGGAVIGALLARRFYTPNEDNASNAA